MENPSSHIRKLWFVSATALLVFAALVVPFSAHIAGGAAQRMAVPPGHSDRILRLKLVEGTVTDDLQALLPAEAWQIIQKIDPLFTLPKNKIKELKDKGDERQKKEKGDAAIPLPDLGLWYEVRLVQGTDPEAAIALFQALPVVEMVGAAPLKPEEPASPDYTSQQGYLGSAPDGIGAQYAWTVTGGTGAGINIYDIEYGWNQNHEDLTKVKNIQLLLNAGDSTTQTSIDHGTAVLGELIADKDTKGVSGIAWGANARLVPANTTLLGWNPANAVLLATADGVSGDVILLEQQNWVCDLGLLGPVEWSNDIFQAIQYAIANGLVVVEAAGNGTGLSGVSSTGVNLDQAACGSTFDRSVRDSGAIIVGAGKPPASGLDRQREYVDSATPSAMWGSSYGSRVDVQGWGSGVMTTGYGVPTPTTLPGTSTPTPVPANYRYTNNFKGTSSASPMVAAAAAIIQSIAIQRNGAPLSPSQVRDLLVQTGSPQQGDNASTEHIGPRPDLQQAMANLPQSADSLTVNVGGSQNDHVCGITNCSLAEAIEQANSNANHNFIVLDSWTTYTLNAASNTDATYGANGLPVITSPISINGNGAIIERSSTSDFRLFQVASSGSLTINRATLRNGKTGYAGGAILNLGTASIYACTITGSSAVDGGALANQGTLDLVSSTLQGNSATGSGGAIQNGGMLTVLGSTAAGNSAASGASISTSITATLKNTLMVKGASGGNCSGTLSSDSVGNMADDSTCGTGTAAKTTTEINLGSLASNGGTAQTVALVSGSAAIDAGNTTACKLSRVRNTDQRGYDRFADGNGNGVKECDIGAFEYGASQAVPPPPEPDTTPPEVSFLLSPEAPDGSNGWYRSAVTVDVEFYDDSGVIEARCALDPAAPPATYADLPEGPCAFLSGAAVTADGPHTLYAAGMDDYLNQSAPAAVSFQIDATAPVLTCPAAGPFLLHSGEHVVDPAGVDASVSGLDEAASTLSGIVTTGAVGPKVLSFTAFDLAGNSASQECSYNVVYDFVGYYPPVEPAPALNPIKAGQAVPLKFSLAGDQGLSVIAEGYWQPVACDTLAPAGDAEPANWASQNGLSYNAQTSWYNIVWKTEKGWGGTCRALMLHLVDGTEHLAYFRFQ